MSRHKPHSDTTFGKKLHIQRAKRIPQTQYRPRLGDEFYRPLFDDLNRTNWGGNGQGAQYMEPREPGVNENHLRESEAERPESGEQRLADARRNQSYCKVSGILTLAEFNRAGLTLVAMFIAASVRDVEGMELSLRWEEDRRHYTVRETEGDRIIIEINRARQTATLIAHSHDELETIRAAARMFGYGPLLQVINTSPADDSGQGGNGCFFFEIDNTGRQHLAPSR